MLRTLLVLALFAPLAAAAQQDASFVPLTNVPILYEIGTAWTLESYLNTLYRILIGAAAVIAVLKIMFEGIKYMGGDSVTEKKDAKNNIAMALGGLVLVLSPAVVFSIINPDILSLRLDTSGLTPAVSTSTPPTSTTTAQGGSCTTGWNYAVAANGSCNAPGGWSQVGSSCCQGFNGNSGVCCGKPPATATTTAAERWGWRGRFENSSQAVSTQQQSPFATKAACEQSLATWPAANNLLVVEITCDCRTPLSQQPGCSTL